MAFNVMIYQFHDFRLFEENLDKERIQELSFLIAGATYVYAKESTNSFSTNSEEHKLKLI